MGGWKEQKREIENLCNCLKNCNCKRPFNTFVFFSKLLSHIIKVHIKLQRDLRVFNI